MRLGRLNLNTSKLLGLAIVAAGAAAIGYHYGGAKPTSPNGGGGAPLPPAPNPTTDADLLQAWTNMMSAASMNPATLDPVAMENLAMQLNARGYTQQAQALLAAAQLVRQAKGLPPASAQGSPSVQEPAPPVTSPYAQV